MDTNINNNNVQTNNNNNTEILMNNNNDNNNCNNTNLDLNFIELKLSNNINNNNNNNNISNNNNNNNNIQIEEHEVIFWKVFHNSYLLNKILSNLDQDIIEYEDINKYYINNRIKFTDIKSLKWMIKHQQWSLLNDKLKSDQYIHVTRRSMEMLIENCKDYQLLKLMYEKRRFQMEIIDLVYHSTIYENEAALDLFINYYHLPIFPSTLHYAISICERPVILNYLKEGFKHIDQITKDMALNYSFTKCNCEMILYLLNHPELYSISEFNIIGFSEFMKLESRQVQRLLIEMGLVRPMDHTSNFHFKDIKSITIDDLKFYIQVYFQLYTVFNHHQQFQLQQIQLQQQQQQNNQQNEQTNNNNKNIDNNNNSNININNSINNEFNLESIEKTREIIKELFDKSNQFINSKEIEQLIFKFFLIQSKCINKFLYLEYLIRYDDIIPNLEDEMVFHYTFSVFSLKGLQYLFKKNIFTNGSNYHFNRYQNVQLFKSATKENEIIQFFKYFYHQENEIIKFKKWNQEFKFLIQHCSVEMLDTIKQIESFPVSSFIIPKLYVESFETYKWLMQVIKDNVPSNNYSKYTYIYSPINSKEVVDFIVENSDSLFKSQLLVEHLEIETLDLAIYYQEKSNLKPSKEIYSYIFIKSINECDIESLKYIEKLGIIFGDVYLPNSSEVDENGTEIQEKNSKFQLKKFKKPIDQVAELFQYFSDAVLYSTKYYFIENIFEDLVYQVVQSFTSQEILQFIKFNMGILEKEPVEYLVIFILKLDLHLVQWILDNQFKVNLRINLKVLADIFSNKYHVNPATLKSDYSSLQVINMIEYLINRIPKEYISHFNPIYNSLYRILLQTKDLTMDTIQYVNDLFASNLIQLEVGIFHIYYWCRTKSNQIAKYILMKHNCKLSDKILRKYYHEQRYNYNNHKIYRYLNPLIFTFNVISQSSYRQLFFLLRFQLSIQYCQDHRHFRNELNNIFNEDFQYLICVGQFEILLDIIKDYPESKPNFNDYYINLIKAIDKKSLKRLFNLYCTDVNQNLDLMLEVAIKKSRLPIIDLILSEYSKQIDYQVIFSTNQLDVAEYLFKNHIQIFEKGIPIKNQLQQQQQQQQQQHQYNQYNNTQIYNQYNQQQQQQQQQQYNQQQYNQMFYNNNIDALNKYIIFDNSFNQGYIEMCNLILQYLPQIFILDQDNIIKAIKNCSINILLYYYNYFKNISGIGNNPLLDFVVDYIREHNDYKILNLR